MVVRSSPSRVNGKVNRAPQAGPWIVRAPWREREAEIISLVAEGMTNKQIAEQLFLSAHTVITHRKNIMNKLGLNNTAGLVLFAIRQNIISPNKFLFSN